MKNSAEQIMKDETKVFFNQKLKEYSTLSEFKKEIQKVLADLKEYPEDNKHQIKFYSEVEIMLDQHIYNSETIESNKLIAEFMGAKPNKGGEYDLYGIIEGIEDGEHEQHFFFRSEMKFSTDWNWLMEVVEKCRVESNEEDSHWEAIYYSLIDLDIDNVYTAVISFIKWYNENK